MTAMVVTILIFTFTVSVFPLAALAELYATLVVIIFFITAFTSGEAVALLLALLVVKLEVE